MMKLNFVFSGRMDGVPISGQKEICVQLDLTRKINLVFTAIYGRGLGELTYCVMRCIVQRRDTRAAGINERCGHTGSAVDRAGVDISNVTRVSRSLREVFSTHLCFLVAFSP